MNGGNASGVRVQVLNRVWLDGENFELTCTRPENFSFLAGQHVSLGHGNLERDYTIVSVRIPRHPASDSTRRRPRIPRDPGRLFQ